VAPTASMLPQALTTAVDVVITIARPDERVVGRAIRSFLDQRTAPSPGVGAGSLDLLQLAATFRKGSAAAIVRRIADANGVAAGPAGDRVPDLETAVEFGAAREWGLAVAKDVNLFLRRKLPWSAIDANLLLFSKPGLGKTTFAQALSQHMNATLIQTSISELFASSPGYLDSVIKQLRDTYQKAESRTPTIILWDEVDALPSRVGLDSRSASFWTSVITDFMLAVATIRPGVVQIACSNFADRIDPALLRPGRFGRRIELLPPDAAGVISMARFQLAGELVGADITEFGELAAGSTAAEVMDMVKRARAVARQDGRVLRADDLITAATPPYDAAPEDVRRICLHEAGHAVVGVVLGTDQVEWLCIGGADGGLGATRLRRNPRLDTRATIEARVVMMLAGRAAELVCLGDICAGSHGDLQSATAQVTAIHAALGLGENLSIYADRDIDQGWLGPQLRAAIESDLRRLHDKAVMVVRKHRTAVEAVAAALAERRHLSGKAARAIIAANPPRETVVMTGGQPEC